MLLAFLPEVHGKMAQFIADNDATSLREIIHKLHGSASWRRSPRMKQLCRKLEKELHQASDIEALEPELLELQDEMENVATGTAHPLHALAGHTAKEQTALSGEGP
ncbi:Hpt domain-containing protein [Pantoea ananatis]